MKRPAAGGRSSKIAYTKLGSARTSLAVGSSILRPPRNTCSAQRLLRRSTTRNASTQLAICGGTIRHHIARQRHHCHHRYCYCPFQVVANNIDPSKLAHGEQKSLHAHVEGEEVLPPMVGDGRQRQVKHGGRGAPGPGPWLLLPWPGSSAA